MKINPKGTYFASYENVNCNTIIKFTDKNLLNSLNFLAKVEWKTFRRRQIYEYFKNPFHYFYADYWRIRIMDLPPPPFHIPFRMIGDPVNRNIAPILLPVNQGILNTQNMMMPNPMMQRWNPMIPRMGLPPFPQ